MMRAASQLEEVYEKLGEVLDKPQAFGLAQNIPQPLADLLRATRQTLGQVMEQESNETGPDDLEAELSQDADCLYRAYEQPV